MNIDTALSTGVGHRGWGPGPLKICRRLEYVSPRPKYHILPFKTVVGYLCKFHIMNDERLMSKMAGRTNFSRRLKQFDGLT